MESPSRSTSLVEEHEVFEITDFTTASDWERFVAGISEILTDWKLTRIEYLPPLSKNELTNGTWEVLTKNLMFANVPFIFTLHRLKTTEQYIDVFKDSDTYEEIEDDLKLPCYLNDMMTNFNDFPPRAHCIARWYGLRCFCILSLSPQARTDISSESKSNILLSSISTVLSDSSCETPIFVQTQESWRRIYTGRCVGSGMQTSFEMTHLRKCPPQYTNLSGLLHVFKSKIGISPPTQPCLVSARFTYVLNDWGQKGKWPVDVLNPEAAANKIDFLFGLAEDGISDLHLYATWPSITENMIVDNDVHSDFDPLNAPQWSIRLRYSDDVQGFLSSYVKEFLKLESHTESITDLISVTENNESTQNIEQALQRLTNPNIKNDSTGILPALATGLSKVSENRGSAIRKRLRKSFIKSTGPLSQEDLEAILDSLLPESNISDNNDSVKNVGTHKEYQLLKSAPCNSLTYRLAVCMTVVNFCHGGVQAVAQLWHEFVQEMRYRLENSVLLPDIGEEYPDLRTCLLHQKFQMLNCCISHKLKRAKWNENSQTSTSKSDILNEIEQDSNDETNKQMSNLISNPSSTSFKSTLSTASEQESRSIVTSDSEDEFFECNNDEASNLEAKPEEPGLQNPKNEELEMSISINDDLGDNANKNEKNNHQDNIDKINADDAMLTPAEGRLKALGSIKLLKTNSQLYIPVTQQSAPLTEDALEEQTKIFSNLGDNPEGASLRLKMQSASLLSDMQSFKAANPGCILEDFVRWYSPRDYEEHVLDDGTHEGTLSDRMKIPGNVWLLMWDNAKPIPARRQKRLFDDTKEGEKIMHFLSSLIPSELSRYLQPMCFHHAFIVLKERSMENPLPAVSKICEQIFSHMTKTFHNVPNVKQEKLNDLLRQFQFVETMIERMRSLYHKFKDVENCEAFVKELLENPEVVLPNASMGECGKLIINYFKNQHKNLEKITNPLNGNGTVSEGQITAKKHVENDSKCFPIPIGKEFILRSEASRPAPQSRVLPHRMYAVLAHQEFRLAGAFSSDTVFF